MNPNDIDDTNRITQIDRRVLHDQPSGIPLVDDLAATVPSPRLDFQQQLEDRLTAYYGLPQNGKGDYELVTHSSVLNHQPKRKWAFIPLTLAAAMLAVVIIGSIILNPNRGGSPQNLAVILQETVSPAAVINVVIALQDLPRGYQFPATIAELKGITGYYPWPESAIAPGMLREDQQGLERLLGQKLSSDVFRDQALISNLFVGGLGENVPMVRNILPDVAIPNGSLVSVIVARQDLPRGYQFPTEITELSNLVTYTSMLEAALPEDALREDQNGLKSLLGQVLKTDVSQQGVILKSLLASDVTQLTVPSAIPALPIPSGQVSVSVPVSVSEIIASGIREQNRVDVVVSMLFTDIDETFQTVQPPSTVIDVLSSLDSNSPCPSDNLCTVTQTVVQNAMILNIEEGATDVIVTLAVSAQDIAVINWILEAKLPYILRQSITLLPQLPSYPGQIPTGMWLSEIPLEKIQSVAYAVQEGDLVDINFSFLWQDVQPEMANTIMPENGRVFTTTILHNAKVYKLGTSIGGNKEGIVTLLITEQEMILLSSLLETTVPYTITVHSPSERGINTLRISDLPDGRLSVILPVTPVTMADNSQWQSGEGNNRVDVVADMNFYMSDADPQLISYRILEDIEFINSMGGGEPSDPNATYINSIMRATIAIEPEGLNSLYSAINAGIPLTVQLRAQ